MSHAKDPVLEMHGALLAEVTSSGRLSLAIGGIRPLVEKGKVIDVADAPSRSILLGPDGRPVAVLFVSNGVDADYVARNVENAAAAKRALGGELGSVILDPLCHGRFQGLSFAIWPWHKAPTSVRGLAYLQRRIMLPGMLSWLRDATGRTMREPSAEELESLFIDSLRRIAGDARMPAPAAELAQAGLERLNARTWRPRVVLQHKDFGYWNVLLPRGSGFPRRFILIDWAGASLSGFPFANLLALARTARVRQATLQAELARHCAILGCERRDILPNVLAGLGYIGGRLGHFAEANYLTLCRNTIQFSVAAVGATS